MFNEFRNTKPEESDKREQIYYRLKALEALYLDIESRMGINVTPKVYE